MTALATLRTETLGELEALAARGGLSPRTMAGCTALIDKLRAPVRIGLVGLPGAGKRRLLNALAGATLADPDLDLPTLEALPSERATTRATLADGSLLERDGLPDAALLRQQPVYLRLTSPAPELTGRRLLLLVTDATAQDLAAGLRWAAPRLDVLLWCSIGWQPAERDLWQAAPESLRNHAILLLADPRAPSRLRASEEGFDTAFRLGTGDATAGIGRLKDHLAATIDEAAAQALHGAQMFLRRHAPDASHTSAPVVPMSADLSLCTSARTGADPEARAELGRLFQLVRRTALELSQALGDGSLGSEDPDALLGRLEAGFEAIAERCADMTYLSEHWPDLGLEVTEARDLALLMRIEGGAVQAADAARLLGQIRTGIEERLAA